MPVRIIICKSRRAGLSTGAESLIFDDTTTTPNTDSLIVGNQAKPSENVLGMCTTFWNYLPKSVTFNVGGEAQVFDVRPELLAKYNNNPPTDRLEFAPPLNSRIFSASAKSIDAYLGHGFQNLHATEVGYYDNGDDLFRALSPTLSDDKQSSQYMESTPNGQTGRGEFFYEQCMDAKERKRTQYGETRLVFIPWHEMIKSFQIPFEDMSQRARFERTIKSEERDIMKRFPHVTLEQLKWRRARLAVPPFNRDPNLFDQEYPCLVGDTLVGTDSGIRPISEIERGAETSSGKVLGWADNGDQECVRVSTATGYTIECTLTHPIKKADGEFVFAGDALGEQVLLQAPMLAKKPFVARWNVLPTVESSVEITTELARFLGYFMGDGSLYGNALDFACDARDEEVSSDIKRLGEKLFRISFEESLTGPNKGCRRLRSSSRAVKEFLLRLGCGEMRDHLARRKVCVPECIRRSPGSVVREFLRALFEADGWVSATKNSVKLFTNKERFSRDVQHLLLSLHIRSSRRRVIKKGTQYAGFELALLSYDAKIFCYEIGFVSARKRAREKPASNRGRPERIAGYVDQVISVDPIGTRRVYDLHIAQTNVFDAGGILVHNSDLATAFLLSGTNVFSMGAIKTLMENVREPEWEGDIYWGENDQANKYASIYDTIRRPRPLSPGEAETQGFGSHDVYDKTLDNLRVWRWPRRGDRIIIGADVGAGNPLTKDGDFSTICVGVLNELERDELIMTWRGRINPIAFGEVCAAIGWLCQQRVGDKVVSPKLVPEWTGPGTATCTYIDQKRLYQIYHYRMPGVADMPFSKHIGWESNAKTKPTAVAWMCRTIENNMIAVPSEEVVTEMSSYRQHDPFGDERSYGGAAGRHDDFVSSFQIMHAVMRLEMGIIPGSSDLEARQIDPDDDYGYDPNLGSFDELDAVAVDDLGEYGIDDDDEEANASW
jgi:hypothetical protein